MILEHRVLVAGGAGFIGSHLAEFLVDFGVTVLCVDNFFSGHTRNIAHLLDHGKFELHRHDVCNPLDLRADEVYNLASVGSAIPPVETAQTITPETNATSVLGVLNLMRLAGHWQAKFFQASGCEVYDDPIAEPGDPVARTRNTARYLASYAAGRRYAETLTTNLAWKYSVDYKIGRIFHAYGPRMPIGASGSVGDLVVRALQGKELVLPGDGRGMQSLTYVTDVVKACVRLMDRPRAVSGPIDIASGIEISGIGLAKRILSLTGSSARIVTSKYLSPPARHRPDLEPGHEILGWTPGTTLDDGLTRTIEYFEALLKAGSLNRLT